MNSVKTYVHIHNAAIIHIPHSSQPCTCTCTCTCMCTCTTYQANQQSNNHSTSGHYSKDTPGGEAVLFTQVLLKFLFQEKKTIKINLINYNKHNLI